MQLQHRFETVTSQDEHHRCRLTDLLDRLRNTAQALELSIEKEQRRTGKTDPSHYTYPIKASAWAQRRDNLKATIALLERHLA